MSSKQQRLQYIGSKHQLIDWIFENIRQKTQWENFVDKKVADLFSGTGIVAYSFRCQGATVIANDVELYSSIITHAFTLSVYTEKCEKIIGK